jgi:hypothetical protein
VRAPTSVPPWAGAGFKNFGIYLGQKTLVHPLCGLSHPPHFGVFNGGGATGAARQIPWPTSRWDLSIYSC